MVLEIRQKYKKKKKEVKLSLQQAAKVYGVVRSPVYHIFLYNRLTDGSEFVSLTRRLKVRQTVIF
jgi:hypothetical protein